MYPSGDDDECKPLKNLDELLSWRPSKSDWSTLVNTLSSRSPHCYAGEDVKCHKRSQKSAKLLSSTVPKTLLCHDMKGGYLDDKFVCGSAYSYQYLFYHWSVVDVFVYFSHHFITIPPLMWINAAHTHGVHILGTLISEHVEGEKIWREILADEEVLNVVVDQLAAIQRHYRFDGYLINIENKIDPSQLPKLKMFLKALKAKMANAATLIWYDAVSFVDGKLRWQNELNRHSEPAFGICDGVFLNYAWKLPNLENSVSNAGVRLRDVYVGVDVFGRGCHGGGGFNSDIALAAIRSFGLSTALFGHGWTHETQASDFKFFAIERKFWIKLYPYLYVHCPNSIPFRTTYNRGVSPHPQKRVLWYDLSSQSLHLSAPSCLSEDAERSCIDHSLDDNFDGDSCLLLNCIENETEIHKLMMCEFLCSVETPLKLTISAKSVDEFRPFQLLLNVENGNRCFSLVLTVSEGDEFLPLEYDYSCSVVTNEEINSCKTVQTNSNRWITNTFLLKFNGTITEVGVKIKTSTMIGYMALE